MISLELRGSCGAPSVPCLFIFGDSLSDSGNNNPLLSFAKANYLPYGIDFPGGATGRFCNGRTTIDLVGDHLGLPHYIQPFANKTNKAYKDGVNYASGSAGIKKETGLQVTLYGMGARKYIVFGLGPLGCLPPITPLGICSPFANAVIEVWNNSLKTMVKNLNAKYKDARFIWINSVKIITPDLKGLGLKVRTNSCCIVVGAACVPLSVPCPNRNNHAYWDFAHPTEAANKILAGRAYKKKVATDAYPMDISELAALKL
ncbi:hypothetical protein KSS87_016753 [Heliosperma pusillum]|nr:hypothetical protein KSS87_021433 [Heliosperma pusillum]KAH9618202.1 hypothetical protein KSS87_016753 [Heliosperma pusillum]